MSDRNYNIDKVVKKIGLEEQVEYDRIEVYVDITDNNNIWANVFLTDYSEKHPNHKQIKKIFHDRNQMLDYVKLHFGSYELTNQVDVLDRKVFFHYVDYVNIDYHYQSKAKNDYLIVNYREINNNGNTTNGRVLFIKEDEELAYNIFKTSKKLSSNMPPDSKYINYIESEDVYRNRRSLPKEVYEKYEVEKKQTEYERKKKIVKGIKIFIGVAALSSLLAGGVVIVKKATTTTDMITQKNRNVFSSDIHINWNQERAFKIIDKMMNNDYDSLTREDIKFVLDYIKDVEASNYDANKTLNIFDLNEYFYNNILFNDDERTTRIKELSVLNNIDEYYKKCFVTKGNSIENPKDKVHEYISYVLSTIFMYDTTVDLRNSGQVSMNTQSVTSPYATKLAVSGYENLPNILKYIIANQVYEMLLHNDYQVTYKPSNYYDSLDQKSLMIKLQDKMLELSQAMYDQLLFVDKTY